MPAILAAPLTCILALAVDAPKEQLTYERDIRPLLRTHCFHCHGESGEKEGGLDVRLRRLLAQGGESGPAIVPGKPGESLLLQRLKSNEMPPAEIKKRPSAAEIERIERWISDGAKTARPEPEKLGDEPYFTEEERNYWAFQPIRRPAVPAVREPRVSNPIDSFIARRLEDKNLSLSPEADKRALLRRVSLDLLGLPPTLELAEQFYADSSPLAYERLIDRLLNSPHYGERWARHWLDIAGYADSDGYSSEDAVRKYAYKYRDYVINAFNANKPIDKFLQEQIAGDEMIPLPKANLDDNDIEKLTATGFLRMAPDGTGVSDEPIARNQVVADTIEIVSTSMLGLTVGCAQCHDHRYDPIPQVDYYRLRAVFEPAYDWKQWRKPSGRLVSLYTDADRQRAQEVEKEAAEIDKARVAKQETYINQTLEKELAKLPETLRAPIRIARDTAPAKRTAEQNQLLKEHPSVNVSPGSLYLYDQSAADDLKTYADKAAAVRQRKPIEEFVHALTEVPYQTPTTFLFHRGDYQQPKQALAPGGLSILGLDSGSAIPADDLSLPTTGRRLAWARRLTDRSHPLTARVFVNRVWMHHFGRGLVATAADFGALGQPPTHPELLDWLASELMDSGWDLKRLHRLILTSATYRQSSKRNPAAEYVDPEVALLWRMPVRRLEAETLRDSVLSISGQLWSKPFGPPIPVMADEVGQWVIGIENLDAGRPKDVVPMRGEDCRRSIYVQSRRSRPLGVLETFDLPAMDPNCDVRKASTVAPQSLMLLNSEFIADEARNVASRVRRQAGDDLRRQAELAWRLIFVAGPSTAELGSAVTFVTEQTSNFAANPLPKPTKGKNAPPSSELPPEQEALATFCQALLSSNAFLYVD